MQLYITDSIQLSCTDSRVGEQDGWCTIEFQDGFVKQAWHQVIATLEEEPSATRCAEATGVAQAHEQDKQEQTPEPKSVTDARFATPVNEVAAAAGTPQMLAHIEAAPDKVTQAVDHVPNIGKRRATRSAAAKDTIHTEPDSWDCSRCTLTNTGGVRCDMCGAKVCHLAY